MGGHRVGYVVRFAYSVTRRFSLHISVAALIIWIILLAVFFYYTLITKDFIDYLVSLLQSTRTSWHYSILRYALILLALWVLKYILNIFGEYLLRLTGLATLEGLATEFIKSLAAARPTKLPDKGDIIGRFISDLSRVSELGGFLASLGVQLARIGIGAFLLYTLNPKLFAVTLIIIPIYYAVFRISSRKLAFVSEQERHAFSRLSTVFRDFVEGLLHVKASPSIRRYLSSASEKNVRSWGSRLRRVFFYDTFFNQSFNSLYDVVRLIVLVIGGFFVAWGEATVGSIIAFSNAVYSVFEPIANISYAFATLGELYPYVKRVQEVLELEPERDVGEKLSKVDKIEAYSVEVEVGGRKLLQDVSLTLYRGRVYAVVGPTGSGKSTLLLTLIRFYEPARGEVRVNGRDYRVYSILSLRERILYLPQHPLVIQASIRDNIALGKPLSDNDIWRALRIAAVDFVTSLDEIVDPSKLSDGQKQRLALARAIAQNPDVLLLDEALNAVDEQTEALIMKNLREEVANERLASVVIVTHRSSTLEHTDYIYVLDKGRIVCEGIPEMC
ncbi:ABC transporter ATP-binding protein [Pyrofollis japonicus]|uniref:ABC transporter ATP-binding protein n=1 Tax=Pyrofollis japonicus TaxID=3060460 RepID=UPI00295A7E5F|nr:ABC transporter ATP-binding protein [Pyrofollis japonicus]BEP18667.1 ABC transporter ATP-binding protein [Pyrofollis japonicus]